MNTGRAVILNPSRPDSVKRREFLLDSLRKSGLEWFRGNRGFSDHDHVAGRTETIPHARTFPGRLPYHHPSHLRRL